MTISQPTYRSKSGSSIEQRERISDKANSPGAPSVEDLTNTSPTPAGAEASTTDTNLPVSDEDLIKSDRRSKWTRTQLRVKLVKTEKALKERRDVAVTGQDMTELFEAMIVARLEKKEDDLTKREEMIKAEEVRVDARKEYDAWTSEQVEGILREASDKGIELATAEGTASHPAG